MQIDIAPYICKSVQLYNNYRDIDDIGKRPYRGSTVYNCPTKRVSLSSLCGAGSINGSAAAIWSFADIVAIYRDMSNCLLTSN